MSAVPSALLVDTNVWLDFFLKRPSFDEASAFMACARCNHADLFVTVAATADIAYLLEAGYKKEARRAGLGMGSSVAACAKQFARSCMKNLQELATPIGMDTADMWVANSLYSLHPDYEDDLMLAAAERANMDYLVTSDDALIKHASIPALTPADARKLIESFVEGDLDD